MYRAQLPDGLPLHLDRRYRLIEPLGRGGTAHVWRAYDERLARPVAVKLLDGAGVQSLQDEAHALARLDHPHIADVYDYGEHDGQPYLVMELIEGRPLSGALGEPGLPWGVAVLGCAQIASALAAAHARGLVHRDVTPANVMLTATGVKVIDFGLATAMGQPEVDQDGGLQGTPSYVAPERLRNQPVNAAGDVYSLGLVLYRALTGRRPWSATTAEELWRRQVTSPPEPLPTIDGLPPEIADLCLDCLAVDPTQRPSAARVAEVLRTAAPADAEVGLRSLTSDGPQEATCWLTPPSSTTAERQSTSWRRTRPIAVLAAVASLGAVAWSATNLSLPGDGARPVAIAAPATPALPTCGASFELEAHNEQQFQAAITVTDHSGGLPQGWRLSVRLPSGSTIETADGWQASDGVLTSPTQPAVSVEQPVRLAFAARPANAIPLPTSIAADDQPCDVVMLGITASPAPAAATSTETADSGENTDHAAHPGIGQLPPGQLRKRAAPNH